MSLSAMILGAACQEQSTGFGAWRSSPQPNAALQSVVDGKTLETMIAGPQMSGAERGRLAGQIRRFYKEQNYQLIWIDGDRPSGRFRQLRKAIEEAPENGLPRELYATSLDAAFDSGEKLTPDLAPEVDVKATASFFRYFLHLTAGRLDPHALQSLWTLKPQKPDLVATLAAAVTANNLADAMQKLQPTHPEYRDLKTALVRYRAIAAKGGWPSVPAATRLKPGEQSPAVAALRERLAAEGDLTGTGEGDAATYGPALVDAVKRFQERHRIKPDGLLNSETLQAMNVTVGERIREIELNMERWRWLPDVMPARYLMVNVPDFRLEAIENGNAVMAMRVVVGEPDNKTPIFADEMTQVVFSPYWNVPPNIAKDETIPRAVSDPGFLTRNNMEVVTASGVVIDPSSVDWSDARGLRIRQRPGSGNALGGVKFMFPNNFDVYLHDTNATKLFDRIERALSHGCIRVEEPHKLAQYVLRDQPEWTPDAIDRAMKSGNERHVKLSAPIPVFIVYKTAWVHDGGVRFLKDLYGYDADQSARLWPASTQKEPDAKLETRRR